MQSTTIPIPSGIDDSPRLSGSRARLAMLLCCIFCISGCSTLEVKIKKRLTFSRHVSSANTLEKQDQLAAALDKWRIALAIYPESVEASQRARTLEDQISVRVSELTSEADTAASRGDLKASSRLLLSALSLQPDNQALFQRIAVIKRREAREKVATIPIQTDASFYVESDFLEEASETSSQVESKFKSGVDMFDSDKIQAEKLFLEVLELDPTHLQARAYLQILSETK